MRFRSLSPLSHSFGFDSRRRANLGLLDDNTLIFIAGNLVVLLDVDSREQRYLRSCSGGGIGAITVSRQKSFFESEVKFDWNVLCFSTRPLLEILSRHQPLSFCNSNQRNSIDRAL